MHVVTFNSPRLRTGQFKSARLADKVFHRDISLPDSLAYQFVGVFECDYTNHAKRAASDDRYGQIKLPKSIVVTVNDVVEVGTRDGQVVEGLVRISYNEDYDLCLPLLTPRGGWAIVKTVWLNRKNDNHHNLNKRAYAA